MGWPYRGLRGRGSKFFRDTGMNQKMSLVITVPVHELPDALQHALGADGAAVAGGVGDNKAVADILALAAEIAVQLSGGASHIFLSLVPPPAFLYGLFGVGGFWCLSLGTRYRNKIRTSTYFS